jgi:uncharacterized protein
MLLVDLHRLGRERRLRLDTDVQPDDPFWEGTGLRPDAPLAVRLEIQQAGSDVVVRGRLSGSFELECRRCLVPTSAGIDEALGLLYRPPETLERDEPEDVLPLPRGSVLDVASLVREQVLLAVPRYVECRDVCLGLCPKCGINRNEGSCACVSTDEDERWAPLRKLRLDE